MNKNKQTKELPISYIKSPFDLIKAPADWNILESKILIAVSIQLQDRFQRFLESRVDPQLSLFSESEFEYSNEVALRIPIKDIGIGSNHYDQVDDACKRISSIIVPVESKDRNGLIIKEYRNLFVAGFEKNSKTFVSIKIHKSVADQYFRGGSFALHLRSIASNCRCSYTPHLYMYLSKFRDYRGEVTILYEELRKTMGMYKYNANGESIKVKDGVEILFPEGMYPRFKDFKKRVLDPAKAEMDKLFEQELVDISFGYDTLYADGSTEGRGNPLKIHFTIIKNIDKKMEQGITNALSPYEIKAIECWKGLLNDLGVESIDGVQPVTFNHLDQPTFNVESMEKWHDFYKRADVAKYWVKHYGQNGGVPTIISK